MHGQCACAKARRTVRLADKYCAPPRGVFRDVTGTRRIIVHSFPSPIGSRGTGCLGASPFKTWGKRKRPPPREKGSWTGVEQFRHRDGREEVEKGMPRY